MVTHVLRKWHMSLAGIYYHLWAIIELGGVGGGLCVLHHHGVGVFWRLIATISFGG